MDFVYWNYSIIWPENAAQGYGGHRSPARTESVGAAYLTSKPRAYFVVTLRWEYGAFIVARLMDLFRERSSCVVLCIGMVFYGQKGDV